MNQERVGIALDMPSLTNINLKLVNKTNVILDATNIRSVVVSDLSRRRILLLGIELWAWFYVLLQITHAKPNIF